MNTLSDIRKAIKPLGFKLKTERLSWGQHATYVHIESGMEGNSNVFTPELLAVWKPLFDWKTANRDQLQHVREETGCIGLV